MKQWFPKTYKWFWLLLPAGCETGQLTSSCIMTITESVSLSEDPKTCFRWSFLKEIKCKIFLWMCFLDLWMLRVYYWDIRVRPLGSRCMAWHLLINMTIGVVRVRRGRSCKWLAWYLSWYEPRTCPTRTPPQTPLTHHKHLKQLLPTPHETKPENFSIFL